MNYEKAKTIILGDCPPLSCDILRYNPINPAKDVNLLVLLPGNPGLIDLYESLLSKLHERLPTFHILGIGHMGGSKYSFLNSHCFPERCNTQTALKLRILLDELEQFRNKRVKLHLSGHSYGSKCGLEVIEALISDLPYTLYHDKVKIYPKDELDKLGISLSFETFLGLTPTIVNIAKSPSGKQRTFIKDTPLIFHILMLFTKFLVSLTYIFAAEVVLENYFHLRKRSLDKSALSKTAQLVNYDIVRFGFEMGFEEMDSIIKPNNKAIKQFSKCVFILANKDPWIGKENETELIKLSEYHSNGIVERLPGYVRHAFVIKENGNDAMASVMQKHLM